MGTKGAVTDGAGRYNVVDFSLPKQCFPGSRKEFLISNKRHFQLEPVQMFEATRINRPHQPIDHLVACVLPFGTQSQTVENPDQKPRNQGSIESLLRGGNVVPKQTVE